MKRSLRRSNRQNSLTAHKVNCFKLLTRTASPPKTAVRHPSSPALAANPRAQRKTSKPKREQRRIKKLRKPKQERHRARGRGTRRSKTNQKRVRKTRTSKLTIS